MAPVVETAQLPYLERLGYRESSPPFVNGLLHSNPDVFVDRTAFDNMITVADRFNITAHLDDINGDIETTRMIHSFIGLYQTPEEVQARLDEIATTIQNQLKVEPIELQENVYRTLKEKDFCDIDALLWLDKQHGELAQQLNDLQTPEAKAFQQRNIDVINAMPNKDIMYLPTYWQNTRLTGVTQYMSVPKMPEENIQALAKITPIFFKRDYHYPDQDPKTAVGFIQQFRKSGHQLTRRMAQFLQEQKKMNAYADKILSQA